MELSSIKVQDCQGFYKVGHRGSNYIIGTFYNPTTNEWFETCICDYDYYDGSRDKPNLYSMEINESVKAEFEHHIYGRMFPQDQVIIFKGRKMLGEVKTIRTIRKLIFHEYIPIDYAYFTDGTRCALENCKLYNSYDKPKEVRIKYDYIAEQVSIIR